MLEIPSGGIIVWSGSIGTIPAGFVICDGTLGTPDLRDKFVPGAGSAYAPHDVGGAVNHTHGFSTDGHTHPMNAGTDIAAGTGFNNIVGQESDTGTTDAASSLPVYHALAYIMKT